MNAAAPGPIWIHPPSFWNATEGKSEAEVAELLDHLTKLLEEGQTETLLRYDFVTGVGYPYPNSPRVKEGAKKSAA